MDPQDGVDYVANLATRGREEHRDSVATRHSLPALTHKMVGVMQMIVCDVGPLGDSYYAPAMDSICTLVNLKIARVT